MSGSVTLSPSALTDAERADVRRFLGYPSYGPGNSGFQGYRFFQAYGEMEFRLTNARPEEFQIMRQYLATLYSLEVAIYASGANLDTDQAAVWHHNKSEVADRTGLYAQARRALADFLGVPPGPGLGDGSIRRVA
jgi:hypothetical protein